MPPVPSRDMRGMRIAAIGCFAVAATGTLAFGALMLPESDDKPPATADTPRATCRTVKYRVFGEYGESSLTMSMRNGTVQRSYATRPQSVSAGCLPDGTYLYVSAQDTEGAGLISCAIEIDGRDVVKQTSTGAYSIATCTGRA